MGIIIITVAPECLDCTSLITPFKHKMFQLDLQQIAPFFKFCFPPIWNIFHCKISPRKKKSLTTTLRSPFIAITKKLKFLFSQMISFSRSKLLIEFYHSKFESRFVWSLLFREFIFFNEHFSWKYLFNSALDLIGHLCTFIAFKNVRSIQIEPRHDIVQACCIL